MVDHSEERFPPVLPKDLTDEQRELHDGVINMLPGGNTSFKYKDDDTGALIGPFPFLLETPAIARAFQTLLGSIAQAAKAANPPLTPECREIAILGVGYKFQAGFELYSHKYVAKTETSFTEDQIRTLIEGKRPEGLDDKQTVAFEVVKYLTETPGPLPDAMYKGAVDMLGKDATTALIHYTGCYCYLAAALNGADIPVPEE